MSKCELIFNDDFETNIWGLKPQSANQLAAIYLRLKDSGVTNYAVKACEFDNKNYLVGNKEGIDWTTIDFESFGKNWKPYAEMAKFLRRLHDEGRPAHQICIDTCREMGIRCTATFRMNDFHDIVPLGAPNDPDISLWLKQHPQFAATFPKSNERIRVADFSHPEVRAYRLSVLKEILTTYDFDGVELDFMRTALYFSPDYIRGTFGLITEDRFEKLSPCLTEFVVEVREFLNELETRRGRDHLTLGVRIPDRPETARAVGLDVPSWINAHTLDYITPTMSGNTGINCRVAQFKKMCDNTDCQVIPSLFPYMSINGFNIATYATPVFAAAAQNYYDQGADGLCVFNHFCPPLPNYGAVPLNVEALRTISDTSRVATSPKHYIFDFPDEVPVPTETAFWSTAIRGKLIYPIENYRDVFIFRLGIDPNQDGASQLSSMRVKIFDADKDDEYEIDINGVVVPFEAIWHQRLVGPGGVPGPKFIAEGERDRFVGEPIPESDIQTARGVIDTPQWRRPENNQNNGRHVFLLLKLDTLTAGSALRHGENILGVETMNISPNRQQPPSIGEIEVFLNGMPGNALAGSSWVS